MSVKKRVLITCEFPESSGVALCHIICISYKSTRIQIASCKF